MPLYRFRIRFHISNNDRINSPDIEILLHEDDAGTRIVMRSGAGDPIILAPKRGLLAAISSGIRNVLQIVNRLVRRLKKGIPIGGSSRVAILGGKYESPEAARQAAAHVQTAVLLWAVRHRIGVDLGGSPPLGIITDEGIKHFELQLKCPVRRDVHGIDVFEDGPDYRFLKFETEPQLLKGFEQFKREFADYFGHCRELDPKLQLACEVYSASFFDSSPRSRFVTLMCAFEALLGTVPRDKPALELVNAIEKVVKESEIDEGDKRSMLGAIKWLRQKSIRQMGKSLAATLSVDNSYAGMSAPKFFIECYDLRSEIMHYGAPTNRNVNMAFIANAFDELVRDLLISSSGLSRPT